MTAAARRVLQDCRVALDMLEQEEDGERWRVLWVGAMALLRAVGHVLRNVDAQSPAIGEAVDAAYRRWKRKRSENEIFWDFINEGRNNILKEYRFDMVDLPDVPVLVENGSAVPMPFTLDENLVRPLTDGFAEGEDARDVYQDAIAWWDAELSGIDTEVSR